MLGMESMDEKSEPKACLNLSGNQLLLLKIENPKIGEVIKLNVDARITGINAYTQPDGGTEMSMNFELDRIARAETEVNKDQDILAKMYPQSPQQLP